MIESLKTIVIGVRFKPLYSIYDHSGEIFDNILKCEYFVNNPFPYCWDYANSKFIGNSKTLEDGDSLNLRVNDVVYTLVAKKSFDESFSEIRSCFNKTVVPHILDKYNLCISRIGIVFSFCISDDDKKSIIKKYFIPDNITEFRFSMSSGISSSAIKKGVNNYVNKIFSLSQEDKQNIISYDYQQHYNPLKPCWVDCKPEIYFKNVSALLRSWLKV